MHVFVPIYKQKLYILKIELFLGIQTILWNKKSAMKCFKCYSEKSLHNFVNRLEIGTTIIFSLSGQNIFSVITEFLCQLTCQSADIMSSLCGVGVRVRVNNFFSKTTRPRDMLFFLKDTLSIEDEKLFKACKSVCSSVC